MCPAVDVEVGALREAERHRPGLAVLLLLVAPLVAEYLLGDLPLRLLPALLVLAPFYGAAALLIREVVRRSRRGWPTMLLLGAAFALFEEGLVTESLFNPDYLFLHGHFLAAAHISWLGTGGWWTLLMLNLHTFWSVGVSIVLVEVLRPEVAFSPWLGRTGYVFTSLLFLVGTAANVLIGWKQNHFRATGFQLAVAAIACLLMVLLAFRVPKPKERSIAASVSPWITGAFALSAGIAVRVVPPRWGWGAVAAMATLDVLFLGLLTVLVRRTHWTLLQTLGLGAGGAMAYGLYAFTQPPLTGGSRASAAPGHLVFLLLAVGLIWLGARRTSQREAAAF